jgi:hypothetical protein
MSPGGIFHSPVDPSAPPAAGLVRPVLGEMEGGGSRRTESDRADTARGASQFLQESVEHQGPWRKSRFYLGCEPWYDCREGWYFDRAKDIRRRWRWRAGRCRQWDGGWVVDYRVRVRVSFPNGDIKEEVVILVKVGTKALKANNKDKFNTLYTPYGTIESNFNFGTRAKSAQRDQKMIMLLKVGGWG